MSIALDRFGCIVEFTMPSVVELLIWTGVGSYGCPISLSVMHRGAAVLQLMKVAAHLALEASDMTFLMLSLVVWMAQLFMLVSL